MEVSLASTSNLCLIFSLDPNFLQDNTSLHFVLHPPNTHNNDLLMFKITCNPRASTDTNLLINVKLIEQSNPSPKGISIENIKNIIIAWENCTWLQKMSTPNGLVLVLHPCKFSMNMTSFASQKFQRKKTCMAFWIPNQPWNILRRDDQRVNLEGGWSPRHGRLSWCLPKSCH